MLPTARVKRVHIEPGRRIIAMSDVHGNPSFFRGLLERVGFVPDDVLVLVGDLLEKGEHSLELLHCVMELAQTHEVYAVCGNCDQLVSEFVDGEGLLDNSFYCHYLLRHPESAIWQLARAAGCTQTQADPDGLAQMRAAMAERCGAELDFLRAMPHILETEHLVFVHGGVPSMENMERLSAFHVMKNDDFMSQGRSFEKYCIVGHWPVTLYDPCIPSARPFIDRQRRIVSIDGGCVLKWDGQLNALILPEESSQDFCWAAWDGLPQVVALDRQEPSADSVNVRWGRNLMERLERGEELSLCRHLETGRELYVLNSYLYDSPEGLRCEDSTDYDLPVEPGDVLSLVAETRRAILVKKDGVTGWYRGRFTTDRKERDYVGILPLD